MIESLTMADKITIKILLFCLIMIPGSFLSASPDFVEPEWRANLKDIQHKMPDPVIFKLGDKPDYQNKIISHLVSLDEGIKGRIIVLRTGSNPQKDFIFMDDRLCSVLYEWEDKPADLFSSLEKELARRYGPSESSDDDGSKTRSYKNNRTCAMLTRRPSGGRGIDIRLYLYPRNLFYFLLQQ